MICAALADGESILTGALASDDTRVMIEGLRQLDIAVDHDPTHQTVRVSGCAGRLPASKARLVLGNSGTSLRFLTALVTLGQGDYRLDGTERMRERPIQDLLDALQQLGAEAVSELGTGCPPVVVHANGLPGGRAEVAGNISSQFLSALLMAAPYAKRAVELHVRGELVSQPYVEMTLRVMEAFGVAVPPMSDSSLKIAAAQCYRARSYAIETRRFGGQLLLCRSSHRRRKRDRRGAQPSKPSRRRGLLRLPSSHGLRGRRCRRRNHRHRRTASRY